MIYRSDCCRVPGEAGKSEAIWLIYPVGLCIVLVIVACNFVGDALRDSLDVRLRRR
jgi:ABC-type dipeptide/oligopeptide/nickel transport system permease subunit